MNRIQRFTVICQILAIMVSMLAIVVASHTVTFQCQKPRCEILLSYHDKWIAFGILLPYIQVED